MRPRYLDRIGIDDRLLLVLFALFIGGCEIPKPTPGPGPGPNPPPVVVTKDATVIVIEETSERDFDTASVLGDITFWTSLDITFRMYDENSPDRRRIVSLVKDRPGPIDDSERALDDWLKSLVPERPGMIVLDKRGKKVWAGRLPKTTDEIKRLVK